MANSFSVFDAFYNLVSYECLTDHFSAEPLYLFYTPTCSNFYSIFKPHEKSRSFFYNNVIVTKSFVYWDEFLMPSTNKRSTENKNMG